MKTLKAKKNIIKLGPFLIIISAVISFLLATTSDMSHQELGALANYIWPPVIGLLTLILFGLIVWVIKNEMVLIILLVILCIYNVYVGFALHIQKDYWPLVT